MNRRTPLQRTLIHLEGDRKHAIDTGRNRLLVTGAVFAGAFLLIAARLVDVTLLQQGREPRLARTPAAERLHTARADITDRNGVLLATNLTTASLFADPLVVPDKDRAARQLAAVLPDSSAANLRAKLHSKRRFVWLRRHLTPTQQYRVNRLGIPGLDFQREERRIYPMGPLAAHVLGFTDVDNRGIAGVERSLDDELRSGAAAVALALDIRVQHIVREELAAAKRRFAALGAAAMVLDAGSGEVVAMVSLPDFDPNRPARVDAEALFNRNTLGVYEMGSTFKIFTTALALDTGTVTMTGGYDATRPIRVSRFWIRDYHPKRRWLSVPEIFIYSSNIGAAKMALDVGGARQRKFMARLGLLSRPSIELPEIGAPLAPSPWRDINTMTIAYGHGLAVSPVQLVGATAAMVNGGVLYPPTLLRRSADAPALGTRILSAATSDKMRRLMRLAVERGTGKLAAVAGYLVGGKTGTAEKVASRRYQGKALLSSFVAAFPMHAPRYVVFAMLDEARGTAATRGYATGGWVAAPAIGRIIKRIGPILGVVPVDESSDRMRRRMAVQIVERQPEERRLAAH